MKYAQLCKEKLVLAYQDEICLTSFGEICYASLHEICCNAHFSYFRSVERDIFHFISGGAQRRIYLYQYQFIIPNSYLNIP